MDTTTYESVIEQIAQSIYSTMLDIDLTRIETPAPPCQESLLAVVQISGQWMGSVVLALSPEVARASAAAMLQIADEDVTDADRQDVAAELVNMVGGNLKSLLPGPSFLSLPTVVAGREFGVQVHDAELIDDVVMISESGPLRICLYVQRTA
jgi:chemotaxis protein CheX